MELKVAAQLYTLRNELVNDFPGVLHKLKRMGWQAVQIDGLFGYSPEEITEVLKETGLEVAGMHVPLDRLNSDLDRVVKEALLFGTKDIFCPYLDDELKNVEGYQKVKSDLLNLSAKLSPLGFRVGYHNHDIEFETMVDGKHALDYLLETRANQFLYPEIDTYWVKKAGVDPLDYLKKFAGRTPYIHLKDMTTDGLEEFAEVGTGAINFEPILLWGIANKVEWYVVEQDECKGSPFDSLQMSLQNIRQMERSILKGGMKSTQ